MNKIVNEKLQIYVTVQIERLGDQLVRARPLGPWRLQAVGNSWTEVRSSLRRRLQKALPTTLPTHLFEGSLPRKFEQWETVIDLSPQSRSSRWESPILVRLQSFRWYLANGQCVVRVPAVHCTLFGQYADLSADAVARQARVALVRMAENKSLLELRERFAQRSFDFASIRLSLPIGAEPEKDSEQKTAQKKVATLRAAASDLTTVKLNGIHGIDARVEDLAENFRGESPQSVLVVGPAGVGKTALVHRLVTLRDQLGLGDRKIWSTSGSRIVSGMSGLGMWQQRCSRLIRQAHETQAIVHLGSLLELLEAGKVDGQPGVASMVRQSIARGRLLAIAECTPEQLALVEREDPMLVRAFVKFELQEPTHAKVMEILRAEADGIAHGASQVAFSEQALEELTRLHARFATYSAMPATPLRLMQTLREATPAGETVGPSDVAQAFSKQTGLPTFLVDDSVQLDLEAIRGTLSAQVIGQAEPVQLLVNLIATLKARMIRPGRPLASLMFIGPTGVGKTEMAKAIARLLYSDTRRMIRIDMSEYASPWSIAKLIGKPGEGDGALTSPIREQPFSVVLLDEFEKADPNVFDLLLQLLGEGRLTDSRGRLADFRNAVVIMTSNLGAETFRDGNFGFGDSDIAGWREHFEREVRRFVRPEFLGRLDRVVPFHPLSKDVVRQVALRELDLLRQRAGFKYNDSSLEFHPEAVDFLCEAGYQPKYGARPLRRAIEQHVTVPLADALSELSTDSTWNFEVSLCGGKLKIGATKRTTKTKSLKELESQVINAWQALGAMARTALKCTPLRDLENEMERIFRRNMLTQRRLKTAEGPSRIVALKEQLQTGEIQVTIAQRLIANLRDVVQTITARQLSLMVAWHRNETLDWEAFSSEAKDKKAQLREVVESVLRGQTTQSDSVTLVVAGKAGPYLKLIWESYRQLATRNGWSMNSFILMNHLPLLALDSPKARRLVSERKMEMDLPAEPSTTIFGESSTESPAKPLADAFPIEDPAANELLQPSVIGFAIEVLDSAAAGWLGDEQGVIHFFDAAQSGNRRRTRYRTDILPSRFGNVTLPNNWPDPVATPDRDPRKLVSLSTQELSGMHGVSLNFAQARLPEALVELMTIEHERALWAAIGYTGIPLEAQLSSSRLVYD
jgi:ATP-dependent Clp protease ATP-binding subunit ClpC